VSLNATYLFGVACLLFGCAAVYAAFRLSRAYSFAHLRHFLYYAFFSNLVVMLEVVLKLLGPLLLGQHSVSDRHVLEALFPFLFLPLMAVLIFQFVSFSQALRERTVGALFKWSYVIYWAAFFATFIGFELLHFKSGDLFWVNWMIPVFNSGTAIFFCAGLFYLARGWQEATLALKRRLLATLLAFFTGLAMGIMLMVFPGLVRASLFPRLLLEIAGYTLPTVYLWVHTWRHYPQALAGAVDQAASVAHMIVRYGISKREEEILALVLAGQSNKQIEDKLFISLRTVEGHIYRIYQKVGVKNRVQLINFLNEQQISSRSERT
jgi:DNA-binding CsgD family transcriptional regulator